MVIEKQFYHVKKHFWDKSVLHITSNAENVLFFSEYHKCMNGKLPDILPVPLLNTWSIVIQHGTKATRCLSILSRNRKFFHTTSLFSGSLPLSFDFSSAGFSRKGKVGGGGARSLRKRSSPLHPTRQRQPLVAPNVFFVFDSGGGHVLERLEWCLTRFSTIPGSKAH